MLLPLSAVFVWASLISRSLAELSGSVPLSNSATFIKRQDSLTPFASARNASSRDIEAARQIVTDAIVKMTGLNKARLAMPSRNNFNLKPGTKASKRDEEKPPPLLEITDQIAHAAALLADVDVDPALNSTVTPQKRAGTFWMEGIQRKGTVPWGKDSTYKVFRNVVTDFGADPSGKTDSTKAIQEAINSGKRCGANCNGSTTKNAIVYFPPGNYKVSSSISIYFGTQIIGDANNWPTIVASSSFVGLGVMSTDIYVENGGTGPDGNALQWYINTARFYGQIRNIKIDIRATNPGAYICALHYQVAQATTLENVELIADSATTQQGMFAENGSGGVMSDITFTGGNFGIYGGAQQFSTSRLTFNGCNTAVQMIWNWGWVWKSITVNNAKVGFRLYNDADGSIPGSVTIMDSTFSNIRESAIEMAISKDVVDSGFTGLILDNVYLGGKIKDHRSSDQILAAGYYKTYVMGSTYTNNKRSWTVGAMDYTRESTLVGSFVPRLEVAPYFERKKNQYADKSPSDFVHLKDFATGDGSTDDTDKVQEAFNTYGSGNKIIFVDAGTYLIKRTVTIPKDAKIVGETWSQFAANGGAFSDASKPIPMFKVGNEGDVGTVEMQDLILTSKGQTPGVTLMEWNIQASSAGSAALWDVHVRLGGATGTELTPSECPPIRTGTNPSKCQVASMLLHVTKKASGYFDNMWLWVGDHMIDDPLLDDPMNNMDQLSVYSARGTLIESQKATWLYGTASEHNVYYQYNFFGAQNIFTTFMQTESPYYQPTPKPPAPFESVIGTFDNDPGYSCDGSDADGCDQSWAVIMKNSQNIHVGAAGTYSWFSSYTQECIDKHNCQKALWLIDSNYDSNRLQNIVGIGAKNIIVSPDGTAISSDDNLSVTKHPKWAHISVYDVPSVGKPPPSEEENGCKKSDRMYSTEKMPQGEIELWTNDGTKLDYADGTDGHQWVTIVNLTPYKMVHTAGPEPYQFSAWDFGDVPSGKARKNMATYDTSLGTQFTDTNGFANYRLDGTDKTFQIHVTTHIPDSYERRVIFDLGGMGMGWRELGFPGERVSVALVITGSEHFGYINSLQLNDVAWMRTMYSDIKDRLLRHVVIPGSHDAGMSRISTSGWIGGGVSSNTATQSLDHYNQLRVGTRYFDIRIVSVNGGDFWAAHVDEEVKASPLGATGESLDELIDGVNRFTADYPGEVIIWTIRYMVDLDNKKITTDSRYWDANRLDAFFKKLEGINNRCLGLTAEPTFDQRPIKELLDKNDNKGCVLLLTNGRFKDDSLPKDKTASGIYRLGDHVKYVDFWAQEQYTQQNADKQIAEMLGLSRNYTSDSDNFYIMQWQCTPSGFDVTFPPPSLQLIANQETNPALYHYGFNNMTPESFPTVILQDAVGLFHISDLDESAYNPMIQTLAIGLNLYMVSQNCDVSRTKHPLLVQKQQKSLIATGFKTFTGVIFSNGTVLDMTPEDFCRTCTFNDTSSIDHPPMNSTSNSTGTIRRWSRRADLRAFM